MNRLWRLLRTLRLYSLANAVALAHNAPLVWALHPVLWHSDQTKSRLTSFLAGWSTKASVGWLTSLEPELDCPRNFGRDRFGREDLAGEWGEYKPSSWTDRLREYSEYESRSSDIQRRWNLGVYYDGQRGPANELEDDYRSARG